MDNEQEIRVGLSKLPRRAIAAFSARCARRVQPLYALPKDYPEEARHREAIDAAIRLAEERATGHSIPTDVVDATIEAANATIQATEAAVQVADVAVQAASVENKVPAFVATRRIVTASDTAVRAAIASVAADPTVFADAAVATASIDDATAAATLSDLRQLLDLNLGTPRQDGKTIDPSPSGPLGPFWPKGEPDWFRTAVEAPAPASEPARSDLGERLEAAQPQPLISVLFDESGFTDEDVELVLGYLSEVYRESGGVGLKVVGGKTLMPEWAEVE